MTAVLLEVATRELRPCTEMAPSLCLIAYISSLANFLLLTEGSVVPATATIATAASLPQQEGASGNSGVALFHRPSGHPQADHVAPRLCVDSRGDMLGQKSSWLVSSRQFRSRRCHAMLRGWASATNVKSRRWWVLGLRGGSTAAAAGEAEEQQPGSGVVRSMKVSVSTSKISSFVDVRGEVSAQSDWTVGRLKEELEKNFPGKIPASVQRLFKGTQLLPSWMTLEEASEGAEGPLSLLLDNAPPIDASKFDPDTAVPSRRDGQVEAFSACLAAQSSLQEAMLAVMRGENSQDDTELSRSVKMKADFENTQALLRRTLEEVPDTGGEEEETFGLLHEALRPLAHRFDVNWMQSAQYALFAYICSQFGATGALRRALTLMLIPMIFFSQTRIARVAIKLARNLAAEIPVVTQLFMGLLQAPEQVIMSTDVAAYTRDLYGPGGPVFDAAFLEEDGDVEEAGGESGDLGSAEDDYEDLSGEVESED